MKQFGILRRLLLYITCPARWVRNLASNSTELNSLASPTRRYLPARM
jgi:hypothetical protein